jgi:hypothetical protein
MARRGRIALGDFRHRPEQKFEGTKIEGGGLGVTAMSQREVVWILVGAVLIAAAGAGAFVVTTYALSLF